MGARPHTTLLELWLALGWKQGNQPLATLEAYRSDHHLVTSQPASPRGPQAIEAVESQSWESLLPSLGHEAQNSGGAGSHWHKTGPCRMHQRFKEA